jgi:hypothetical protein
MNEMRLLNSLEGISRAFSMRAFCSSVSVQRPAKRIYQQRYCQYTIPVRGNRKITLGMLDASRRVVGMPLLGRYSLPAVVDSVSELKTGKCVKSFSTFCKECTMHSWSKQSYEATRPHLFHCFHSSNKIFTDSKCD